MQYVQYAAPIESQTRSVVSALFDFSDRCEWRQLHIISKRRLRESAESEREFRVCHLAIASRLANLQHPSSRRLSAFLEIVFQNDEKSF